VSSRGNERSPIYRDDADRRRFLEPLAQIAERYRWLVLAYCLMGNHYHLLAQTPEPNLAHGMRQLNGVYAQSFNRRHARVGHLFQGRYGARLVQADEHLLSAVRYIVRNPVQAGLCRNPEEWRWSSHRAALGREPPWFLDRRTLLAYFGSTRQEARERYRVHCEREDESDRSPHPLIDGDEPFIISSLERIQHAPGVPRRYLRAPRPALVELLSSPDPGRDRCRPRSRLLATRDRPPPRVNVSTIQRRLRRH
jgi:REP element-mobilizing transposase RayT